MSRLSPTMALARVIAASVGEPWNKLGTVGKVYFRRYARREVQALASLGYELTPIATKRGR